MTKICVFSTPSKQRKPQIKTSEKLFIFQLVTLDPDGMNEHFDELTHIFTQLESQVLCPHTKTKIPLFALTEGWRFKRLLWNFYGGNLVVKNTKFSTCSQYRPRKAGKLSQLHRFYREANHYTIHSPFFPSEKKKKKKVSNLIRNHILVSVFLSIFSNPCAGCCNILNEQRLRCLV